MLSLEEVTRIARLARIEVAGPEAARLRDQLNGILELVDRMRAVDTAGVEPMAHPQEVVQRLRADEVDDGDRRADFQAIAPEVQEGLYLVPRVVE